MPWYFILLIVLVVIFAFSLIGIGVHEVVMREKNLKEPGRQLYKVSSLSFTLGEESEKDVDVLFAGLLFDDIKTNNNKK